MSKRRIGMNTIKKIIQLSETTDLSIRQIAKCTGVSRPKVSQVLSHIKEKKISFSDVRDLSDSDFQLLLSGKKDGYSDKYKKAEVDFPQSTKDLKKVGVTVKLLWEEYIQKHPNGFGKSQFAFHFKKWRDQSEVSMHIEYKVGDKLLTDYAGKRPSIISNLTGEEEKVELFISILPATHKIFAEIAPSQKSEDWLRSNRNSLEFFGGVPKAIVSDNLKSAVIKADKYEPDINPQFSMFAEHYNTAILPTRAMSPKDKALVEGAVKIVYQQIIAPLRNNKYFSIEDYNEAIKPLLKKLNNKKMKTYNQSREDLFLELEKNTLLKLPNTPYVVRDFERIRVQFNYHARLKKDNHFYSVPYLLKGKQVNIYFDDKTVEIIYNNQRVAIHSRDRKAGRYTTNKDHMPSSHRFIAEWNPNRISSWASKIGENTKNIVCRIMASKKHPEQGFKSALGIIGLEKKYSKTEIENACNRALYFEAYSYRIVKNILNKGIDTQSKDQLDFELGDHENIRDDGFYK